jgi:galactokinase
MSTLSHGLMPLYVNLTEVDALVEESMVRLAFGAKLGAEGISGRTAVVMSEERAEAFAHGILAVIRKRREMTWNAATKQEGPP